MNILVTGGNGRMARHFESTDKLTYYLPSRQELDLSSLDSIDNYLNSNALKGLLDSRPIQGLVLNAFHYPPGKVELDSIRKHYDSFLNATKVNLLATIYLYKKLKENLKFIIFFTTGLNPKSELSHIYYRNSKLSIIDLLERISYSDTEIKTLLVHPGHMHDEYTFKQSTLQVTKMIENLDEFKHLGHYGIFDKDKMEYRELESLTSYNTVKTIKL